MGMEAVVGVTSRLILLFGGLLAMPVLYAGILAPDRVDAMYHSYSGGGVDVTGPSYLIRKGDGKRFSGTVNYYVDSISSASVDVVTQGSAYSEQRTQWSGSVDYLHADTTMTAAYANSSESDYKSDTYAFSISQSMFGDLTTVALGYSYGADTITSTVDDQFRDNADHKNFHVSLTQIVTKNWLLSLNYDLITDSGYLQSPYRSILVLNDPDNLSAGTNFNTAERYPSTRTSNAASASMLYYLPYRASLELSYRFFNDDWGISANTAKIGYTHPLWDRWIVDAGFRYYEQSSADFYADLFDRPDQQNFVARDKELSNFQNYTV
ncbi:hypothetical protein MNBD_GAMMA13-678, partial [hydrothermal vent metagenome]